MNLLTLPEIRDWLKHQKVCQEAAGGEPVLHVPNSLPPGGISLLAASIKHYLSTGQLIRGDDGRLYTVVLEDRDAE